MPVLDQLAASAAHYSQRTPHLAATVASDAAYLLAHAAEPGIEHALDGRVPHLLAALDHAPAAVRDAVFAKAKRAADPVPSLPGPQRSPAPRPGHGSSWLRDDSLRELLGAAVYTSLQLAEIRYTGTDRPDARWTPGSMPLPEALHRVCTEVCGLGGLDPKWVPFLDIQAAHAIARANELPPGAGPLDDRIPAYMAHVVRLEPITQADTLANAVYHYTYVSPDTDFGKRPGPVPASPRTLAARTVPGRPASAPASPPVPDATGSIPPPSGRKALR